ncbi:DNA-3-methyladenine glycosylase [Rhodohalobacter halophilus]|uniref:DNA-3-methyladenine glycosylase n=1 Tax=Rhodohalobacter halophilus TaxID=1812810 RepID=UPI00083FD302|nr:DNA-3-methyladenine glycosylase [Rhodohalobacter halophilus]
MFTTKNLLPTDFYANPDVVDAAQKLLGKVLCSHINGEFTSGIISETEAYCGRNDKACHANNGKRTERTEVMFGEPGHAYIYLCYGIHHLFNVVTNQNGLADAVLVRGILPLDGHHHIQERRNIQDNRQLCNGPGKLTQALGITTNLNKTNLRKPPVWIEDRGIHVPENEIIPSKRVGVEYAGDHADRLWRFEISSQLRKKI